MKVRWCVLLVGFSVLLSSACGDGAPDILGHHKNSLIQFKRITLASDAPDRVEIEIEVLTGSDFSRPAPDGTTVVVETTVGHFEGRGPRVETTTIGGHALVTLILPGETHLTVKAVVNDTESRLTMIVDGDGSLRIGSD